MRMALKVAGEADLTAAQKVTKSRAWKRKIPRMFPSRLAILIQRISMGAKKP
jgi:hypothetical protein